MGKKVKIASFGLNCYRLGGKTYEDMMEITMEKLKDVRGYHPDLIVLPEGFLNAGGDRQNPRRAQLIDEMMGKLCAYAREVSCYIIASVYEPVPEYPEMRYNCAHLIDRQGHIIGTYRKRHTVMEETTQSLVMPAKDLPVFDTDFGRIGIQICFDIGWRDGWRELAEKGAKMVVWSSAYDGGNLLNAYAAHNMYYVVSSVRTDHPRVVDPTGRTIAMGSHWNGLCLAEIDLETTIFHIDRQFPKIDQVRRALGDKVTINTYSEENIFTITSNDEEWPMERICKAFGLMSYQDYHAEATRVQKEWRAQYPAEK